MAVLGWWLGEASASSATVVIVSDTAGTVYVDSLGAEFGVVSGVLSAAFSGSAFYVKRLEITGLASDRRFAYRVRHSDGTIGYDSDCLLRTMPVKAPFRIAWFSCMPIENEDFWPLRYMRENDDFVALCPIDDFPYDAGSTKWYPSSVAADNVAHNADNALKQLLQIRLKPLMARAMHRWPTYYMPGDHDALRGDDWDHSVTNSNTGVSSNTFSTQAEVDAHWWMHNQATLAVQLGNPLNSDSEAVAEKPSSAEAGTSIAQYPVRYFRKHIGPLELFFLDQISARSPTAATDNSSKKLIGDNQRAWLKARLSASPAPFKAILGGKKLTRTSSADNGDTWGAYTNERDLMLDDIKAVTSVVYLSGDKHHRSVQRLTTGEGFPGTLVDVCACGVTQDMNGLGDGYLDAQSRASLIYKGGSYDGIVLPRYEAMSFGELYVTDHYIQPIIRGRRGVTHWSGKILRGSNDLT